MATDSPLPQPVTIKGISKVMLKGTPHLWQMALGLIVACIAVTSSMAGLGKWYVEKSAENVNTAAEAREARIKLHQLQFKMILRSIVENKNPKLTDQDKQLYTSLLQDISYEDVKSLLEDIKFNADRRDLDLLIKNNQVEARDGVTDIKWNNGWPAQIRFMKRKNMSLDFQKIDVYSAPPDACSSKVIPLGNSSTASVQICESHLNQRLELIVIQDSE